MQYANELSNQEQQLLKGAVLGRQILIKKPGCTLSNCGLLIGALLVSSCGWDNIARYSTRSEIVPKTEIIAVENGRISIPPPNGFCKDARSSKNTETSAILIFARCGYLNSNYRHASEKTGFSGVVTASISKTVAFQNSNGVEAVADFLSSREGLEALSASGHAETVSIVDKQSSPDGIYVQLHDTEATLSQNVWKSFLNRSDHLVTVTLLQNKQATMTDEQSMQFLQNYSETIQLSKAPILPRLRQQPDRPTKPVDQTPQLKKVGFLRRLLF